MSRQTRSEPGLDILRGLLVIAMFAVHARRLQPGGTRVGAAGDRALDALMWSEPFIAAGFLFVVGTSLVLSLGSRTDVSAWRHRMLKRAAVLWALSLLLFVPQYGVELPDLLVSSGILSVIAFAIAGAALALASRRPVPWLSAMAIAGIAATALLDRAGIAIAGVNAGPGGALPLVSFTAIGALTELGRRRFGVRAPLALAAAAAPALTVALVTGAKATAERSSLYAEHAGLLALPNLFAEPARRVPIAFWNHTALGAAALLVPIALAIAGAFALPHSVGAARSLEPLRLLGRHALAAYVLHLGVLGVIALSGHAPHEALVTWALVGGLVVVSLVAARVLDRRGQSPPASAGSAAAQTRTS